MAKQFRFSADADLNLLREAVSVNPYQYNRAGQGWSIVYNNLLGAGIFPAYTTASARTVRDRLNLLIAKYESTSQENESNPDVKEEYGEREQLLEELLQLRGEAHRKRETDLKQEVQDRAMFALGITPVASNENHMDRLDGSIDISMETTPSFKAQSSRKRRLSGEHSEDYISSLEEKRLLLKEKELDIRMMELKDRRDREDREREERAEIRRLQAEREEKDRQERMRIMDILVTAVTALVDKNK